jgi:hypothetical protein
MNKTNSLKTENLSLKNELQKKNSVIGSLQNELLELKPLKDLKNLPEKHLKVVEDYRKMIESKDNEIGLLKSVIKNNQTGSVLVDSLKVPAKLPPIKGNRATFSQKNILIAKTGFPVKSGTQDYSKTYVHDRDEGKMRIDRDSRENRILEERKEREVKEEQEKIREKEEEERIRAKEEEEKIRDKEEEMRKIYFEAELMEKEDELTKNFEFWIRQNELEKEKERQEIENDLMAIEDSMMQEFLQNLENLRILQEKSQKEEQDRLNLEKQQEESKKLFEPKKHLKQKEPSSNPKGHSKQGSNPKPKKK